MYPDGFMPAGPPTCAGRLTSVVQLWQPHAFHVLQLRHDRGRVGGDLGLPLSHASGAAVAAGREPPTKNQEPPHDGDEAA